MSAFGTTTIAAHITATAQQGLPVLTAHAHLTKAVIPATPMVTAEREMFVAADTAGNPPAGNPTKATRLISGNMNNYDKTTSST
jgi:hypothetical protein